MEQLIYLMKLGMCIKFDKPLIFAFYIIPIAKLQKTQSNYAVCIISVAQLHKQTK